MQQRSGPGTQRRRTCGAWWPVGIVRCDELGGGGEARPCATIMHHRAQQRSSGTAWHGDAMQLQLQAAVDHGSLARLAFKLAGPPSARSADDGVDASPHLDIDEQRWWGLRRACDGVMRHLQQQGLGDCVAWADAAGGTGGGDADTAVAVVVCVHKVRRGFQEPCLTSSPAALFSCRAPARLVCTAGSPCARLQVPGAGRSGAGPAGERRHKVVRDPQAAARPPRAGARVRGRSGQDARGARLDLAGQRRARLVWRALARRAHWLKALFAREVAGRRLGVRAAGHLAAPCPGGAAVAAAGPGRRPRAAPHRPLRATGADHHPPGRWRRWERVGGQEHSGRRHGPARAAQRCAPA